MNQCPEVSMGSSVCQSTKCGKVIVSGKVKRKLISSDRDPAGGRVITYKGWPLYTYVADTKPGMTTGQALNLNGGLWYVLSPSGKVLHKKVRIGV